MKEQEWIHCPVCGNKTRLRIREDSILINFPLYCPKCRKESLIAKIGRASCRERVLLIV